MDRGPFGATPRLRRRRTATVATVDRVRGWIAAQVSRTQACEIRRPVSVSPRILASGTGDVWTAAAHLSLGGPVRDRCEDLNARAARRGACAPAWGVRAREG